MFDRTDTEAAEAVVALGVAAAAAGAIIGYAATEAPNLAGGVEYIALAGALVAIVVGQVTRRLLDAGKVPVLGVTIAAPDNATTGFYAVATAVMLVGLTVELLMGAPNPVFLLVFVACGAVCFQRGFRRGVQRAATIV